MKYFILDEEGKLVEASLEQIQDLAITLYNEDGEVVREAVTEEDPADPAVEDDEAIRALTDNVSKLADTVGTFVSNSEKEKKVKAQQGFPLDGGAGPITHTDSEQEVLKFLGQHWDIDRQGKEFDSYTRKWGCQPYPKQTDEKLVNELFKYFGLVSLASKYRPDLESMKAMELFNKVYGTAKTAIGDTGNLFPIPDIVEAEIIWFARERSYALARATVVPMISEKESWPRETGQATVQWGNTTANSDPTVDEVELDAEELSVYSTVKNAHMADSRSDIVAWLTANLGEAAGLELDNMMFNGIGTDDPFICSGLLTAACGNSVTMASGSTAFSQITTTLLSSMIAALDGVRKTGARFMMNGAVIHFVRDLKDSNGRPIFMDGNIGTGVPSTIFGYPYDEVIKMTGTSAANTAFINFGNPAYFYVGRRLDSATLDVNPYLLWTTNRTAYKLYQRWALIQALPAAFVRLLTAAS